ncbi:MipA/OmpV family protein [Massilia sp. YMA4]|uniref:MipA/OmpV family protein n=1 Tax=Massilia sp. YMA4 TaxID=1593482 RepID=UPI000DD13F89|nr:MipA/OmpV family protein [Massilia sp. YMA4]AXA94558.1 MipA/OmpV family protein [Massilia sp. YMA4]
MGRSFALYLACCAWLAAIATPVSAAQPALPLWEAGIVAGAASTPAYPGADDRSTRALALPLVVYRGKVLRADRSGINARLFDSDRVELDVGFAASLPARSRDVALRDGMPDLRSLVEFGPRLKLLLAAPDAVSRVRLELPLRAPFELGHGFRRHGFVFEPRIVYETGSDAGTWQAAASVGAIAGNARLHAYFYDVAPQYATPWRPAYRAHGGLLATRVGLNLSRRLTPDWRVFGLVRYDHLGQAANRDSPLLRRDGGWSAGVGVTWTLYRSAARAWD